MFHCNSFLLNSLNKLSCSSNYASTKKPGPVWIPTKATFTAKWLLTSTSPSLGSVGNKWTSWELSIVFLQSRVNSLALKICPSFLDQCCFCFLTLSLLHRYVCFNPAISSLCFFFMSSSQVWVLFVSPWQAVGVELLFCSHHGSDAAQKHTLFKASGPFLSQFSAGPHGRELS